jgi:hypothetical protein
MSSLRYGFCGVDEESRRLDDELRSLGVTHLRISSVYGDR